MILAVVLLLLSPFFWMMVDKIKGKPCRPGVPHRRRCRAVGPKSEGCACGCYGPDETYCMMEPAE